VNESAEQINALDAPDRFCAGARCRRAGRAPAGRCLGADEHGCSARRRRSARVGDGGGSRSESSPDIRCALCVPSVREVVKGASSGSGLRPGRMASWHAGCYGGSRGGIRGRSAHAGPGRVGSDGGCQGRRDCRAAPPADGVAPAGRTAALQACGPDGVGHVVQAPAAGAMAGLSGHARDAAALASRVGGPPLDLSAYRASSPGF
jgi:hypothetical protein